MEEKEPVRSIVVFSADLDKTMAAFNIAIGAAATGFPINMYFTFWGLNILRKPTIAINGKSLLEIGLSKMLPAGPTKLSLSKMNMGGVGTWMIKQRMKAKSIACLPELIEIAKDMDICLIACQMTMLMMGITKEDMIDGLRYTGVAGYLGEAERSHFNLFI